MWQIRAAQDMKKFLSQFMNAEKIVLKGSVLDSNLLDIYSDVDMEIHLPESAELDITMLIAELCQQFNPIFGYEAHCHDDCAVLRICFENGQRFDLTIFCGSVKKIDINSFADGIDVMVNQFWFTASMVLTKLGRKDYLIASHLALGLCQTVIVIQMMLRDNEKCTNIHRFGGAEDVPVLESLVLGEGGTKEKILSLLFHAAKRMDEICIQLDLGYAAKSDVLENLRKLFII